MASKTKNFKKNKQNDKNLGVFIGSVLILLVVVISFILAPALSDLANNTMGDVEFGSYGNEKITFSQIENTPFQREIAQLSQNGNGDSTDYRTVRTAYNTTVTKAAAIDEFLSNGYVVTKEQVDKAVLESTIYNENGAFSSVRFKNTPESRKKEIRDEIKRLEIINAYETYTIYDQKRSSKYIDFITSLSDKKRNFKYVTLEYSDYPTELILKYGKENSEKFRPYDLSMITVDNEKKADEILKKLKNKDATFSELAKLYSNDNFSQDGGKVPSKILKYEVQAFFEIEDEKELDNFSLNSEPLVVKRNNNINILKLNTEVGEPNFADQETIDLIKQHMLSSERGVIEDYFIEMANSANGDLLSLGKEVKETGLFAINYGSDQLISSSINSVNKDQIFGRAVNNENFFKTLFSLDNNEVSEPIVLGDSISIFQLKEEVIEESDNTGYDGYISYVLANYKKMVNQNLVFKSDKFINKFNQGYDTLTSAN